MNNQYPALAILSFVIVSLFGLLLRMMFVFPLHGLNYQFLLHAHSHFAFSAWIFLSFVVIIANELSGTDIEKGLNRVKVLTLVSAAGMLISFSCEGYKAISIAFSTLFIISNFYFSILLFRSNGLKSRFGPRSRRILKAALFFLCFSSAGPLALGPIMAAGLKGGSLYHNAIYFYLHFQMNGWMLLAALSVLINKIEQAHTGRYGRGDKWIDLFVFSTIPLFFIFMLWSSSLWWIRMLAIGGAALNFFGWAKIVTDMRKDIRAFSFLAKAAIFSVSLKVAFQLFICVPAVGNWVFSQRNVIIGYIHLLMLGGISPVILAYFSDNGFLKLKRLHILHRAFMSTVVIYVLFLFIQPLLAIFSVAIPAYLAMLLTISAAFLIEGGFYLSHALVFERQRHKSLEE